MYVQAQVYNTIMFYNACVYMTLKGCLNLGVSFPTSSRIQFHCREIYVNTCHIRCPDMSRCRIISANTENCYGCDSRAISCTQNSPQVDTILTAICDGLFTFDLRSIPVHISHCHQNGSERFPVCCTAKGGLTL